MTPTQLAAIAVGFGALLAAAVALVLLVLAGLVWLVGAVTRRGIHRRGDAQ